MKFNGGTREEGAKSRPGRQLGVKNQEGEKTPIPLSKKDKTQHGQ